DRWRDDGAEVAVTVDQAVAGWTGHVGVVTQLLGRAEIESARTTALICGPEVMMRLTARELRGLGVPTTRIRAALERDMGWRSAGTASSGRCSYAGTARWSVTRPPCPCSRYGSSDDDDAAAAARGVEVRVLRRLPAHPA